MVRNSLAAALVGVLVASAGAHASTTIVNLNADPSNGAPNAGHDSVDSSYNPVSVSLTAGTYSVSLSSIAGGGLYDAYSVATPPTGNYTDAQWSVSLNGTSAAFTQGSLGRATTAAGAQALYASAAPYVFTLSSAQSVSFYVDDAAYPYFADDTGGVSLALSSVAVPEPASIAMLGLGVLGLVAVSRRRRGSNLA